MMILAILNTTAATMVWLAAKRMGDGSLTTIAMLVFAVIVWIVDLFSGLRGLHFIAGAILGNELLFQVCTKLFNRVESKDMIWYSTTIDIVAFTCASAFCTIKYFG